VNIDLLAFLRPEKRRKFYQPTNIATGHRRRRKRSMTRHQMKLQRKQKHGLHKPY